MNAVALRSLGRCAVQVAALMLAAVLSSCGGTTYVGTGHTLTIPQLKYRLVDQVGRPLFCGPPMVRVPTAAEASNEVAALRANDPATFNAIVVHEHLNAASLTTDDERQVLQQVDILRALQLSQTLGFDYIADRNGAHHVAGTIDRSGAITLSFSDPTTFPGRGGCPICLAAADLISTPSGDIPVTRLRPGMVVWTLDAAGRRVAAPILRVGHLRAPAGHQVLRITLADRRAVEASPGHPTADRRRVGDLRVGELIDGSRITVIDSVPYIGETWDLLPAGPTGDYWANGVLLGSTLR
jgi:hypothetical protein